MAVGLGVQFLSNLSSGTSLVDDRLRERMSVTGRSWGDDDFSGEGVVQIMLRIVDSTVLNRGLLVDIDACRG